MRNSTEIIDLADLGENKLHNATTWTEILDKKLQTNSRNYAKQVFLWTVLQLIFCNFLPKNVKI